jgi:hypothetical protein
MEVWRARGAKGGVTDEWVIQLLQQGDAQMFKKYSQMKLTMKREALEKLNRQANEMALEADSHGPVSAFWYSFGTVEAKNEEVK